MHKEHEISVEAIARVEGEGGLEVIMSDGHIKKLELQIYEPPRFFEGFLQNKKYDEVIDFVARICGICPISYQMAASSAMEMAFDFQPTEQTRIMRRIFSWAEVIQSHALHVYFLALPDFLGYDGAIALNDDQPEAVARGLRLKRMANDLSLAIGGREVHPVWPRVGGFFNPPGKDTLEKLSKDLDQAAVDAMDTLELVHKLQYPDFTRDAYYLSLVHPEQYALNEGEVGVSDTKKQRGIKVPIEEFPDIIIERQVPYANCLRTSLKDGSSYQTGPLARINQSYDLMRPEVKETLERMNFRFPSNNPFHSITARTAEIATGILECKDLVETLLARGTRKEEIVINIKASEGHGISEAPRGSLYHHYQLDDDGKVLKARIIPPTEQNQQRIEEDLMVMIPQFLDLNQEELTLKCEMAIRNYDPCISCATHFLKLDLKQT